RGLIVTGVQTCALPIWSGRAWNRRNFWRSCWKGKVGEEPRCSCRGIERDWLPSLSKRTKGRDSPEPLGARNPATLKPASPLAPRSEERRVGKECRARST